MTRAAYWVFRRELRTMLAAPIVYVVGGVFLVVQGVAFAGLVATLSDLRRPAPLGALLEGQLAGTLLTWVLELVVLTLLGMRAIADDKRSGAWELLLTAQVGEGAAVLGKWLAAALVYALLWVPTLAYLVVVAIFRTDSGGWDAGAIACGYLGAIAIGAALLAWAIAASAAMSSSLGAGALGFAFLIGLFLVGELPSLAPDLATDHPTLGAVLEAISLRETALVFARGELAVVRLVVVAGLAVLGLSLAVTLACAGRRRASELRTRALGSVAVAAIATFAGILAARHPASLDASAAGRNTLDPVTRDVLATLPGPARITIVRPTVGSLDPIYDEAVRVAERMADAAHGLAVHVVDPADVPGGLTAVARAGGLTPTDLAQTGGVIVDLDTAGAARRKVIDLIELATIARTPDNAITVERVAIEQALAGALASLVPSQPVVACATSGHGELPMATKSETGLDWSAVGDRLRATGITVEEIAIGPSDVRASDRGSGDATRGNGAPGGAAMARDIPARCRVVIVAGPATPFTAEEALAVQSYVRTGRGLLVAAASRAVGPTGLVPTGLEAVLAPDQLGLPPAIVVEPASSIRELPGAFLVVDGYAEHPVNRGFQHARGTIWFQPRAVVTGPAAHPLIVASRESWGETDQITAPPRKDGDDLAGPVAVAALGSAHRVIAVGSAESLSTQIVGGGASAGDLWLAQAVRFLADAPLPTVDVAARAPSQVRLVLTDAQRSWIMIVCVGLIPLAWTVGGGAFVYWRRRRAAAAGGTAR